MQTVIQYLQFLILVNSALFVGVIIWNRKRATDSALALAVTLILVSLHMGGNLILTAIPDFSAFALVELQRNMGLLYGPLFYRYFYSVIHRDSLLTDTLRFHRKMIDNVHLWPLHFIPFALMLTGDVVGIISINMLVIVILGNFFVYLALSWHMVLTTKVNIDGRRHGVNKQALLSLLTSISLIIGFNLLEKLTESFAPQLSIILRTLVYVAIFAVIVCIFYFALSESKKLFSGKNLGANSTQSAKLADEAKFREIMGTLDSRMVRETLYLDPDLTLAKLARKMQLNQKFISAAINTLNKQTFTDFINAYRIAAARKHLSSPENSADSILDIALNSGFNAKSSFNRVFKSHTGQTPQQYRAKAQN